jgi:hypothetical protein
MVKFNLEKIDTSSWLTKDKNWMEGRNKQWSAIEKVVGGEIKKTEVNVIKQYFLRGKMPKWEKYCNDLYEGSRHLDLMLFLWLHPSNDLEVLKPLYRCYMESDLIHPRDVTVGYRSLIIHELSSGTGKYKTLAKYPFPFLGDKNIIVFRLLFEDIDYAKQRMFSLLDGQEGFDKHTKDIFDYMGYHHFLFIKRWLLQGVKSPLMLNNLYQYDEVLDWCLTTLSSSKGNEFIEGIKTPVYVESFQKALYCIYHFDSEKNEDSCRSRALVKVRQLLDDNDFVPEFKQMWVGIKSGEIEVKKPWKR